jgi:TatD DNase family protein
VLRSKKGYALTARMPPDRVLTDTDGPFGMVSGNPLQARECAGAIKELATLWQLNEMATQQRTVASLRELTSW